MSANIRMYASLKHGSAVIYYSPSQSGAPTILHW